MGVAAARGAARKLAPRVAREQGATNARRNGARLPALVEHGATRIVVHHHDRRITRQPPRHFRGNVDRAISEFERAVNETRLDAIGHVERTVGARRPHAIRHLNRVLAGERPDIFIDVARVSDRT